MLSPLMQQANGGGNKQANKQKTKRNPAWPVGTVYARTLRMEAAVKRTSVTLVNMMKGREKTNK